MRIPAPMKFTCKKLRERWALEQTSRIHRLCEESLPPDEQRGVYPAIDLRASTDKKGTP